MIKHTIATKILSSLLTLCLLCAPAFSWSEEQPPQTHSSDAAVMQQFISDTDEAQRISDNNRHRTLFFMGLALLILILTTAGLGLAMVLYQKPMYVAHMLFAGLTITLSIAHAVVAMVWFYPF